MHRAQLESWLGRKYKTYRAKKDVRIDCPFCRKRGYSDDTSGKLYLSHVKHTAHCFRCGYSTHLFNALAELLPDLQASSYISPPVKDVSGMKEALAWNTEIDAEAELSEFKTPGDSISKLRGLQKARKLPYSKRKHYLEAWKYLKSRGVTEAQIADYDLRVLTSSEQKDGGQYIHRLIFPVKHLTVPIYYVTRVPTHKKVKIKSINPGNPRKRHALFGWHLARNFEWIYLCEGTFDAFKLGWNAVAILGSFITEEQLDILARNPPKKIVVAMDGDARLKAIDTMIPLLQGRLRGTEIVNMYMEYKQDPGALSTVELKAKKLEKPSEALRMATKLNF